MGRQPLSEPRVRGCQDATNVVFGRVQIPEDTINNSMMNVCLLTRSSVPVKSVIMKPKEYVKKYRMMEGKGFDHQAFFADLAIDFQTLLEYHQSTGDWHFSKFEVCVKDINAKFKGISNKARGQLTDKQWSYFFATVVAPIREELFGEYLKKRREKKRMEYEDRQYWRNYNSQSQ